MFLGLLAVLVLAAVLGGVPFALVTVLGLPIPHNLPPLSVLTHRLDVISILRILSVIVWLAWLQLSVCVLVEVRAAIRGVGLPARVPLSGHPQTLAHWLVAAALLLFSAGTAIAPVLVRPGPVPVRQTHFATAVTEPGRRLSAELTSVESSDQRIAHERAAEQGGIKKIYVVEAPEGRHHDSLWEIAERFLGDGRRYRQIFEMNSGRVQPDGTKLTVASLIRPGWILDMPPDAHGPGIRIVHGHAPAPPTQHPAPPTQYPAPPTAQPAPPTQHPAPPTAQPAPAPRAGGTPAPGHSGAGGGGVRTGHGKPPVRRGGQHGNQHGNHGGQPQPGQQAVPLIPYELSAASLLAAGVLAALGRRRREQLWRRAFGRRIPLPEGEAAAAETALRLGADEPTARVLDAGLRQMSRALAEQGRQPPAVFAAFVARHHLDLWLAYPDPDPPAPWTAQDGGSVWRLLLSAVPSRARDEAGVALAPYPGLVSIGTNDDGRVLIDPGTAGGIISLRGPSPLVRGALAALAVELATSSWSDRLQLTLVGFGTELTLLAPGRVTAARTLDEVLPAVEARVSEMAQALAAAAAGPGMRDLGDGPYWEPPAAGAAGQPGQPSRPNPDAHPPHYILLGIQPTAEQSERLRRLARSRYGVPIGCVVAGEVPGAAWTLDIAENGRLHAGELGLDLTAQVVPDRQYASVVELFRTAARTDGPALAPPELFAAPVAQLAPDHHSPVDIQILGPIAVNAAGSIEPARRAFATELVVYVATHPEGVHPAVLTAALWPRGAPGEVAEAAIARVREWLGTDDVGRPNLGADVSGRLRLGSQVRVDWQVFRTLVARAIGAPGDGGRAEYLAQALALVRGPLLEGHDRSRYTWLATDGFEAEVAAWVADTAHQLAGIRLAARDPRGAMEAARLGLRLAGGDEMLWRDLLRAAHATGWEHVLRDVVRELSARVAIDPVLPRMAPETEALIDELLPSWRSSVV